MAETNFDETENFTANPIFANFTQPTKIKPSPRYGHAACQIRTGFAIYGGKLSNGSLSAELWYYDVLSNNWSLRAIHSKVKPPALTRHSLTAVNDEIYLFGGSTRVGEFSSR